MTDLMMNDINDDDDDVRDGGAACNPSMIKSSKSSKPK
jgi:hypothetical protein